ncbi:uncharacterized protein LOC120672786, partial [Panicum virgatum]|uniref:uncharacterized protein LOC120672786 n=1 Tax=Panicum virgatum TaxID=38727 RepID=UPI0019D60686
AAAAAEDLHRQVGVASTVGIDLAPAPPLVVRGGFHAQPFPDATFDFEFSNVFDHALYPDRFAAEIEWTLRPGGGAVLHVAVHRRGDKYSANDLLDVQGLVGLFRGYDVVRIPQLADRAEYYCWLLLAHQLALCMCIYQSSSPHMLLYLLVLGFGLFIYLIAVL